MTFSSDLKSSLIRSLETYPKRIPQVLCGVLHSSARISDIDGVKYLNLYTENFNLLKLLKKYSERLDNYSGECKIEVMKKRKNKIRYALSFSDAESFLKIHGIYYLENEILPILPSTINDKIQRKKDYVAGFFLASAYISSPKKSYHLEFSCKSKEIADTLIDVLSDLKIRAKYVKRTSFYVVYIKDSDIIADLLSVIGADSARFVFEDEKIIKDFRNRANRQVNCDTANLDKIADVSNRQILAIKKIESTVGLASLSDKLREAAEKRLEFPELSMKELGALLDPPIGKSGINHRFTRIEKIASGIDEG